MKNTKVNYKKVALGCFGILIATLILSSLSNIKPINSIVIYYGIIIYITLLGVNFLVAFIRVSDVVIPSQLKLMHFFGLLYNLPREEFQVKLLELTNSYGKSDSEKHTIRQFLKYSTLHFYLLIFALFFAVFSFVVIIFILIPTKKVYLFPLSGLTVFIVVYGAYEMYKSVFTKSTFANVGLAFRCIKIDDIGSITQVSKTHKQLDNQFYYASTDDTVPNVGSAYKLLDKDKLVPQVEAVELKQNDILIYEFLFKEKYRMHISAFDDMLNELACANATEWFGTKYFARLYYDQMVASGVMKKLSAKDASKCFASRFYDIKHGTFKGNESNADMSEFFRKEIDLLLARLKL